MAENIIPLQQREWYFPCHPVLKIIVCVPAAINLSIALIYVSVGVCINTVINRYLICIGVCRCVGACWTRRSFIEKGKGNWKLPFAKISLNYLCVIVCWTRRRFIEKGKRIYKLPFVKIALGLYSGDMLANVKEAQSRELSQEVNVTQPLFLSFDNNFLFHVPLLPFLRFLPTFQENHLQMSLSINDLYRIYFLSSCLVRGAIY